MIARIAQFGPHEPTRLTPLAAEVYRQLRGCLRREEPSVTYGALAVAVSKKIATHHRSAKFHAALGEVTAACRRRDLPAITAIVWAASGNQPSPGYFLVAHPRARSDARRREAWTDEYERAVRYARQYPARQ